jgi:hypothetical protein
LGFGPCPKNVEAWHADCVTTKKATYEMSARFVGAFSRSMSEVGIGQYLYYQKKGGTADLCVREAKGILLLGNLESVQKKRIGREGVPQQVYPNTTIYASPTYLKLFHQNIQVSRSSYRNANHASHAAKCSERI